MTDKDGSTAPPLKAAWTADDHQTIDHFRDLVDRFGVDTQALGWRDSRSQTARFEVLASGGLDPEASLLDIGCGQGDLFAWLRENGYCVDYCGVDLTPEMVSIARTRFPEARFEVADLFELDASHRAHHVIASGIFSTRQAARTCASRSTTTSSRRRASPSCRSPSRRCSTTSRTSRSS